MGGASSSAAPENGRTGTGDTIRRLLIIYVIYADLLTRPRLPFSGRGRGSAHLGSEQRVCNNKNIVRGPNESRC